MYERNVSHIEALVKEQNDWRGTCINLIASENVTSRWVRGIMGSNFAHRYAEGHPGERYYQGTEIIDEIESLLKQHMKSLFRCRNTDVRPVSGTIANDAVMVNSTKAGGHISHHRAGSVGKYTKNIVNFPLTADGWHIDVEHTLDLMKALEPRVMIMGKSQFLFPEPVREIAPYCRAKGIHLIYDAAHVLGLIAGHQFQDPLGDGALIMTASTHKTFFGSQRGVILSNLDDTEWRKIDKGAFPGSSSNHHLETLMALSFATYEMLEFGVEYARQVVANAKRLARRLFDIGFKVQCEAFGFTESHQVAIDMTDFGGGDTAARDLKDNRIIANMNLLPRETVDRATNPAGVRLGVQEMTRVGMKEPEMDRIAELFKRCLMDKTFVGDEVREFRAGFQDVCYSFDDQA
jgi:glycine hydroxymethyltransferase